MDRDQSSRLTAADLTLDARFRLCASGPRRWVVDVLSQAESSLTMADLAERARLRADGSEAASERHDDHPEVLLSLYHVRLPPLVDAGVVSWDREADALDLTADARRSSA